MVIGAIPAISVSPVAEGQIFYGPRHDQDSPGLLFVLGLAGGQLLRESSREIVIEIGPRVARRVVEHAGENRLFTFLRPLVSRMRGVRPSRIGAIVVGSGALGGGAAYGIWTWLRREWTPSDDASAKALAYVGAPETRVSPEVATSLLAHADVFTPWDLNLLLACPSDTLFGTTLTTRRGTAPEDLTVAQIAKRIVEGDISHVEIRNRMLRTTGLRDIPAQVALNPILSERLLRGGAIISADISFRSGITARATGTPAMIGQVLLNPDVVVANPANFAAAWIPSIHLVPSQMRALSARPLVIEAMRYQLGPVTSLPAQELANLQVHRAMRLSDQSILDPQPYVTTSFYAASAQAYLHVASAGVANAVSLVESGKIEARAPGELRCLRLRVSNLIDRPQLDRGLLPAHWQSDASLWALFSEYDVVEIISSFTTSGNRTFIINQQTQSAISWQAPRAVLASQIPNHLTFIPQSTRLNGAVVHPVEPDEVRLGRRLTPELQANIDNYIARRARETTTPEVASYRRNLISYVLANPRASLSDAYRNVDASMMRGEVEWMIPFLVRNVNRDASNHPLQSFIQDTLTLALQLLHQERFTGEEYNRLCSRYIHASSGRVPAQPGSFHFSDVERPRGLDTAFGLTPFIFSHDSGKAHDLNRQDAALGTGQVQLRAPTPGNSQQNVVLGERDVRQHLLHAGAYAPNGSDAFGPTLDNDSYHAIIARQISFVESFEAMAERADKITSELLHIAFLYLWREYSLPTLPEHLLRARSVERLLENFGRDFPLNRLPSGRVFEPALRERSIQALLAWLEIHPQNIAFNLAYDRWYALRHTTHEQIVLRAMRDVMENGEIYNMDSAVRKIQGVTERRGWHLSADEVKRAIVAFRVFQRDFNQSWAVAAFGGAGSRTP